MYKPCSRLRPLFVIALLLSGAILVAPPVQAGNGTTKSIKMADADLSCDQIAHEVVELDRVIREARASQRKSDNTGTGISVARTVGSLLIGSLGGVVGIVAVGALAGEAVEESGEDAASLADTAEERQSRLAGVYEGKGCEGELALTKDQNSQSGRADVATLEPAAGVAVARNKVQPRYND